MIWVLQYAAEIFSPTFEGAILNIDAIDRILASVLPA